MTSCTRRSSRIPYTSSTKSINLSPDFTMIAAAHGIDAHRVTKREEVIPTVQKVRESGRPALIDFRVVAEEAVYPMVPAGADLHEMIRRPKRSNPSEVPA